MKHVIINVTEALYWVFILILLSGLGWLPLGAYIGRKQEMTREKQDARIEVIKRVNKDMEKACKCWYSDTRCNAPATRIVVCSMPEFMREVP